ncbi:hypothetical protein [Gordonia polyisoprenivorans]|uniref:hypothetical protein n=1 Tax=Gordonia polyisoprenivorans TaxID=84595 RepID=UPI001AD65D7A|nr:hypothetical protein [Gordonia polyisoprenivorans]QTI69787.1 hypothetical protein J6U32_04055 [Gordonia polyisoprenivorans]
MILPVYVDYRAYRQLGLPRLGQRVHWRLFWNSEFANWWSGLRPGLQMAMTLYPTPAAPPIRMFGLKRATVSGIAVRGGARIDCRGYDVFPDPMVLTGAVKALGTSAPSDTVMAAVTSGMVTRMQLVSVVMDCRTSENLVMTRSLGYFQSLRPIAGMEVLTELGVAPEVLAAGATSQELLLVDLEVGE